MTDLEALIQTAEARGWHVRWHKHGPKAVWVPRLGRISLRIGMTDIDTLCALAHELGHAHYHDPPGHEGWRESRADKFAARLLISPTEYALAEHLYGPYPSRLAHELGVTRHLIEVWQTMTTRHRENQLT